MVQKPCTNFLNQQKNKNKNKIITKNLISVCRPTSTNEAWTSIYLPQMTPIES